MKKWKYLLLGAGRMARGAVAYLGLADPGASVHLVDRDDGNIRRVLGRLPRGLKRSDVSFSILDVADRRVRGLMRHATAALSGTHYRYNRTLTLAAADARCHMVDLGGNVAMVRSQLKLGARVRRAGVTVIPDCGLAPGMTNILALRAAAGFQRLDRITIRVGGVPLDPVPPLGYMLLFAPEGLFNEYVEDGLAIRGGRVVRTPSLADVEHLRFPEPFGLMEAFSTSGGSSTLVETFRGKVKELNYKTVRYPGHCAVMQGMKQAGLMSREPVAADGGRPVVPREFAGALFEKHLAFRGGDAALVRVTVEGRRRGRRTRRVVSLVDRMDRRTGLTAMMRCTAFPAACIVKMLADGVITARGVHRQEKVVPAAAFVSAMRAAGLDIKLRTSVR